MFSFHLAYVRTALDFALFIGLLLAWFAPHLGERPAGALERFGTRLAERKRLAVFSIAALTIGLRLSLLWALPVPVPSVHDEFSYLLAADTFAHGRLTNPPHPMWIYFDTIHVNQLPTYMSKYPPAQGAVLAFGQLLGHPWIGVLLSTAAMCGAIVWALQGWLPPQWALLGGVLVMIRIGIFSYWMNSYWGGSVASLGGALVIGAFPRILHFRRTRDAVLMALGMAILANSRLLEGFVFCIPVVVALAVWFFRQRNFPWKLSVPRLVLPFLLVMLSCGIFIAYYDWRLTGHPLLTPYQLSEQTYNGAAPIIFWQRERPPLHYLNPQFDAFYNVFAHNLWLQTRVRGVRQGLRYAASIFYTIISVYFSRVLCIPFIVLPWMLADRRTRFLMIQALFCFLGFLLAPAFQPHYAAPLVATMFALLVQAWRHLRQVRYRDRPVGLALSRLTALALLRGVVVFAIAVLPFYSVAKTLGNGTLPIVYRSRIEAQLQALPGRHLVIVRYGPAHNVASEWVYNRADIDDAKIVWAREIPGISLDPLLDYFRNRQVWLVEADASPPVLIPFKNEK